MTLYTSKVIAQWLRLAAVTRTGVDFYLNLPTREFAKLNDEVAEEWRRAKH